MRRAQLSIEFIMIMAMAFIIGALFLASAAELFARESDQQRIAAINDLGYGVQDELILATTVMDGYERTFVLPARADRFGYTITSIDRAIMLTSGTVTITYSLPTYTGDIEKGSNTITKSDGEVFIT